MIAAYKKKTNNGIGIFIILNVLMGLYAIFNIDKIETLQNNPLLTIGSYASFGFLIYGLYNYAKGKGYSGWLCLLGFLYILGLIILVVLPDKRKNG